MAVDREAVSAYLDFLMAAVSPAIRSGFVFGSTHTAQVQHQPDAQRLNDQGRRQPGNAKDPPRKWKWVL